MFSMSNLYLYVKTAEPLPLAYVTKLHLLLRGDLTRYRYIFDINRLPYSVALTKMLPFWYLTSKHCHSNTVNVFCHVSAGSFSSVRDFAIHHNNNDNNNNNNNNNNINSLLIVGNNVPLESTQK